MSAISPQTRCKFRCDSVTHHAYGSKTTILSAVHSSDINTEDHRFQKATPSGKLELTISHGDFFEPGKSYYLDIQEVE